MNTTEDRGWLTEGAEVAILTDSTTRGREADVKIVKVEKILKPYVLAGGRKFRTRDLTDMSHKDAWSPSPKLLPVDHPEVTAADRGRDARRAAYALTLVIDQNKLRSSDPAELLRAAEAIRDAATKACTRLMRLADEAAAASQPADVPGGHAYGETPGGDAVQCQCGETSQRISTVALRKEWHRSHKLARTETTESE